VAGVRSRAPAPALVKLFHEGWKYFLVSLLSLAVDMAVVVVLYHLARNNLGLTKSASVVGANILSVSAGLIVNYLLSVRLVFSERRFADRRAEFAIFVAIGVAGVAINTALVWLFVVPVGLAILIGKIAAAGVSFVFNFAARRLLLFTTAR
jgi:putative flippase GtrA